MRAVRGEMVNDRSFLFRSRGNEKHRVFPLPVPTSRTTSLPHNMAWAASNCHRKGCFPSLSYALSARRLRSSSSAVYCLTLDWRGMARRRKWHRNLAFAFSSIVHMKHVSGLWGHWLLMWFELNNEYKFLGILAPPNFQVSIPLLRRISTSRSARKKFMCCITIKPSQPLW